MNKTILIFAIFAFCLAPALSSNLKGSEDKDRELAGIKLGNLGDIIGSIIGAIKNQTTTPTSNNTNTTTPPATNNTNTTTPSATNNTGTNTTIPPVTNNTNTTIPPVTNNTDTTTPPVTNNTNTTTPPVTNNTNTTTPTETNNTNTTTPVTPPTPVKYAKNDVNIPDFPAKSLAIHNVQRAAVGVAPLTWSDSLAASAQAWAENMAANGFRHSGKTGENIASTTASTSVVNKLLVLWVREQDWFIKGCKYPACSSNGEEVGHYTQMVWAKTTQVGCGFAPGVNKQWNYLCCQYYKAGNIVGQTVYPVPTA